LIPGAPSCRHRSGGYAEVPIDPEGLGQEDRGTLREVDGFAAGDAGAGPEGLTRSVDGPIYSCLQIVRGRDEAEPRHEAEFGLVGTSQIHSAVILGRGGAEEAVLGSAEQPVVLEGDSVPLV